MRLLATLSSPLKIHTTKSKTTKGGFILNLNNYRNTFQMKLNKAKILYKEAMEAQIRPLPVLKKIAVRFTLFPKTHRRTDTTNVCCIHDKYFLDALVEFGKLVDDNFNYHVESSYRFGQVDPLNPRVDIEIYAV